MASWGLILSSNLEFVIKKKLVEKAQSKGRADNHVSKLGNQPALFFNVLKQQWDSAQFDNKAIQISTCLSGIITCFSGSIFLSTKNGVQIDQINDTGSPQMTLPVFWWHLVPTRCNKNSAIWQTGMSGHNVDRCITDIKIPGQQTSYRRVKIKKKNRENRGDGKLSIERSLLWSHPENKTSFCWEYERRRSLVTCMNESFKHLCVSGVKIYAKCSSCPAKHF